MAAVGGAMTVPQDSQPSLACSRMATMAVAQTDGRGSGSGSNNSRGNGTALLAVPSLVCVATSWWRGRQLRLGIVCRPLLTGMTKVGGRADNNALALLAVPSLTRATVAAGGGRWWLASAPAAVGGG